MQAMTSSFPFDFPTAVRTASLSPVFLAASLCDHCIFLNLQTLENLLKPHLHRVLCSDCHQKEFQSILCFLYERDIHLRDLHKNYSLILVFQQFFQWVSCTTGL